MPLPVGQLTKQEIVDLANWKCSCGHTGLEHYSCYLREGKIQDKTCILDIETTNLDAPFGLLLCWGIKEYGKDHIVQGVISKKDLASKNLDKRIIKECVDELKKYAVVITYNGTFFDLRWLRAKALHYGLDFPEYGSLKHIDLYFIVRNRLKIGRNSLKNACHYLGISGKTEIEWDDWLYAMTQAKTDEVKDHNEKDLIITEKLFDKLKPYSKIIRRSI